MYPSKGFANLKGFANADLGATVFLTKSEAEQALAEQQLLKSFR
jgi:hypothetical protein